MSDVEKLVELQQETNELLKEMLSVIKSQSVALSSTTTNADDIMKQALSMIKNMGGR